MIAGRDYLVAVDIDPEADREAWLASRLLGHGGSDVAKILSEHPQGGPIDVWLEHTGGAVAMWRSPSAKPATVCPWSWIHLASVVLGLSGGRPRSLTCGAPFLRLDLRAMSAKASRCSLRATRRHVGTLPRFAAN